MTWVVAPGAGRIRDRQTTTAGAMPVLQSAIIMPSPPLRPLEGNETVQRASREPPDGAIRPAFCSSARSSRWRTGPWRRINARVREAV